MPLQRPFPDRPASACHSRRLLAIRQGRIVRTTFGVCLMVCWLALAPLLARAHPPLPAAPSLAAIDRLDDVAGKQVHVVLVEESGTDEATAAADASRVQALVAQSQQWLAPRAYGRQFRYDRFQGALDLTVLTPGRGEIDQSGFARDGFRTLLTYVAGKGLADANKLYLVLYLGQFASGMYCGLGALGGQYAVLFLRAVPSLGACPDFHRDPTDYWELAIVHELFHVMGAVPSCAPHARDAHTDDDPTDLMYVGAGRRPDRIDPGHDDYFATGRRDCPDVINDPLWEPAPRSAAGGGMHYLSLPFLTGSD